MCENKWNLFLPNTVVMCVFFQPCSALLQAAYLCVRCFISYDSAQHRPRAPWTGQMWKKAGLWNQMRTLKQFGLPVSAVSSRCVRTQSHSRQCHLVVLVKIRPWKIRDLHYLSLVTDIPSFYVFALWSLPLRCQLMKTGARLKIRQLVVPGWENSLGCLKGISGPPCFGQGRVSWERSPILFASL